MPTYLRPSTLDAALHALAEAASHAMGLDEARIFDALMERETLGSTGLGSGVAVPHARLNEVEKVTAVFVRLEHEGAVGYGEATLPPYLPYDQEGMWHTLGSHWSEHGPQYTIQGDFPAIANILPPPARAALHQAYKGLKASIFESPSSIDFHKYRSTGSTAPATITLGHLSEDVISHRISSLPNSTYIKLKLGGPHDLQVVRTILELDQRSLLLDGNQAWRDLRQATELLDALGTDRIVGLEQPFAKERFDLHGALKGMYPVPIYGDESIQGPDDLKRAAEAFDGVNLKLMKCGGTDVAEAMIKECRDRGLKVMLGCMSESSLGCAAMASLQHEADIVDLDGPWLIANDPFEGMTMREGRLWLKNAAFPGVRLKPTADLRFFDVGT